MNSSRSNKCEGQGLNMTIRRMAAGKFMILLGVSSVIQLQAVYAQIPTINVDSRDFIRDWLLCGPFPNPLPDGVLKYNHDQTCLGYYTDYLQPIGGEGGVQPKANRAFIGLDGKRHTWRRVNATSNYVDLYSLVEPNQEVVIYAACKLKSDSAQDILFGFGSNDGIKAWLNGDLIWDNHLPRSADPDFDWVPAFVNKGSDNLLLLKIGQGWGAWGFYARLLDRKDKLQILMADGAPVPELECERTGDRLKINMGRVSRYRILDDLPRCTFVLEDVDGNEIAKTYSILGFPEFISLKDLEDGPYWITGMTMLPGKRIVERKTFYYHGTSTIRIHCYDRDGNRPKADDFMSIEALDKNRIPLSEGIRMEKDGAAALLRTDVSPFLLRILLPSQQLGRQWLIADNQSKGFTAPSNGGMEIDLPLEVAKSLRLQLQSYLADKPVLSEWHRKNLEARLRQTALNNPKPAPGEIYETINNLTSFKSRLTCSKSADIWFAPNVEKVGRNEPTPTIETNCAYVAVARHEYEAFQIVLRPQTDMHNITVHFVPSSDNAKRLFSAKNVSISLVEYVEIKKTTDEYGTLGWWPDPLPPLTKAISIKSGLNTTFWITVYAPKNQPGGLYKGTIEIRSNHIEIERIPVEIEVYDFTLPDETHTASSYALYVNPQYHAITNDKDIAQVHELYMRFAAEHRISPRTPHAGAGVHVQYEGEPPHPVLDFTRFDEAMQRYLDEYNFTSFDIGGLPASLCGYPRYSQEYNRLFAETYKQVQEHLREKNWLSKAYWYWIDEPLTYSYPEVKEGLQLLKTSCPDIHRLLTLNKEPAPFPYFYNLCDLWIPLYSFYDETAAHKRQKLGELVWWYVCCGPLAPCPNNFIDHPAINPRIRFWMMDARGVDGELYWSATWWTQNPWEVAMSYGNGDGRLIYPPQRSIPKEPLFEGPVTSIRFEALRDGIEDREYLILMRNSAERSFEKKTQIRQIQNSIRRDFVPDLTCFEMNPIPLMLMRHKIAKTIEK